MHTSKRQLLVKRTIAIVFATVALSGCSLQIDPSGPAVVVIVSGQNQSAPINTKLTTDLSVAVTTQFGELVSGQTVTWVVVTGTGTLDPATSVTGDTGAASTSYTTGSASGTDKIQAKVGALPPVTFTVTVTP